MPKSNYILVKLWLPFASCRQAAVSDDIDIINLFRNPSSKLLPSCVLTLTGWIFAKGPSLQIIFSSSHLRVGPSPHTTSSLSLIVRSRDWNLIRQLTLSRPPRRRWCTGGKNSRRMIRRVSAPYLPSYQIGAIELQLYYSTNNLTRVKMF